MHIKSVPTTLPISLDTRGRACILSSQVVRKERSQAVEWDVNLSKSPSLLKQKSTDLAQEYVVYLPCMKNTVR